MVNVPLTAEIINLPISAEENNLCYFNKIDKDLSRIMNPERSLPVANFYIKGAFNNIAVPYLLDR